MEITLININSRLSSEMELFPRFVLYTFSTVYSRFLKKICVMPLYIVFLKVKVCVFEMYVNLFTQRFCIFYFLLALGLSGFVW